MDFNGKTLREQIWTIGTVPKQINDSALQHLNERIESHKIKLGEWSVNVFFDDSLVVVQQLIGELKENISSSINFQEPQPVEQLENKTLTPTLVIATGDVNVCQEKLKEKDCKTVILLNIIEQEAMVSAKNDDQALNIWRVMHQHGNFYFKIDFKKKFESFVRINTSFS
ncbi:uncharacterized protein LOC132717270 [Ruditapes philippinarum]|uniref:uncharacterized protein LOC132717270 n=1 Tax=Ruditapes philippinarum TaxID=129788 RepID=UPI00295A57E5|nr:uncharacterized protein LOC132717270 [Ruditapes philippinarum]